MNTLKHCCGCKETKPIENFSKQARNKDGLQSRCKQCDAKYRADNREKRKQQCKEYYYKNQERLLEYKRKQYIDNKEVILKRNAEYYKNNYEKIYLVKKPYCRIKSAERRAIKLNATPQWLSSEHKKQIKIEYQLAEWCSTVTGEQYEVDHIIPLKGKDVCGLHVPWNLQVITAKDNRSKNNRIL